MWSRLLLRLSISVGGLLLLFALILLVSCVAEGVHKLAAGWRRIRERAAQARQRQPLREVPTQHQRTHFVQIPL